MIKPYKYFSPFPYDNNYQSTKEKNDCIAFRAANKFYLNNNPSDITPIMFLHPISSRVSENLEFGKLLEVKWGNFDIFLLNAKAGLIAGDAENVLRFVENKLNNKDNTETITLNYLKNTALFILGKYYSHQLLDLTDNSLLNCQYILSALRLDYLKGIPDNKVFEGKLLLLKEEILKNKDSIITTLLRANLLKYELEFNLKKTQKNENEISFKSMIAELGKTNPEKDYYSFLALESKRRIQEYLFNHYFQNTEYEESYNLAREIISYDQNCPRAHFLLGKVLLKLNKIKKSSDHFFTSLAINNQEKNQIAKLMPENSMDFFFIKKDVSQEKILKRFGAFFDPNQIDINSTISFGPWTQWQSIKNKRDPLFQTLTSQRAMALRFRKELYFSLNFINPGTPEINRAVDYFSFLKQSTPEVSAFLSEKNVDNLTKSLQSRLLASLGFYREAFDNQKNFLEGFKTNSNIENSYALSTLFFIEQILYPDQLLKTHQIYSILYESIPRVEETLRIRLTMQMSLCVIGGQHNKLDLLEKNYKNLMDLFEELKKSNSFSAFEKNLLSSRVYRASSYLPYLKKDANKLLNEIELCQKYALELIPTNYFEEILKLENKFPMYESSARTYSFLGEYKKASHFMNKIVEEVDKNDSKAWLQVGELQEKNGNLEMALESYKNASMRSCPLGKISYFKLGRLFEKLGQKRNALFAYLGSLHHWPIGPSPLKRISDIASTINLEQVQLMAEKNLKYIHDDYL